MKHLRTIAVSVAIVLSLSACCTHDPKTQDAAHAETPSITGTKWLLKDAKDKRDVSYEFRAGNALIASATSNGETLTATGTWATTGLNTGTLVITGRKTVACKWSLQGDTLTFSGEGEEQTLSKVQ